MLEARHHVRDSNGDIHISRTSELDTECVLLTGKPSEFGLISAIREVADVESEDGFVPCRDAYLKIAQIVNSLAALAGEDFARHYRVIARLVVEYASSLAVEVAA